MAERSNGRVTSHHLEVSSPAQVRNVVLVGPSQSGKTSLVEALLLASGAVTRSGSVAEHNTIVSDAGDPSGHRPHAGGERCITQKRVKAQAGDGDAVVGIGTARPRR